MVKNIAEGNLSSQKRGFKGLLRDRKQFALVMTLNNFIT